MSDSDFPFLLLTVLDDGSVELWHTDRAHALFRWRNVQKCIEDMMTMNPHGAAPPCRLDGHEERDGTRYCLERYGFAASFAGQYFACDRKPLPLHRTEAGYPRCSTCDGGGCLDCTDPA